MRAPAKRLSGCFRSPGSNPGLPVPQSSPETVRTLIDDYDAIAAVVQLYIDGSKVGDSSKLEQASHPDARMFGRLGPERYDVPIQELFKLAASDPMGTSSAVARQR